jgi:hypothetical protein
VGGRLRRSRAAHVERRQDLDDRVGAGAQQTKIEDVLFVDAERGWIGGYVGVWKRRPA